MPVDWKGLLAQHGPQLVLGLLAGKTGGLPGATAFNQGQAQHDAQQQQLARQQQQDAQQQELHQAQMGNLQADNARADQQAQQQQLQHALALIDAATQQQGETATDPAQAENAIMQRANTAASLYHLPPDALTGMVPNMGPVISTRRKKQVEALYEKAKSVYGEEALANDAITIDTGELMGGPKKPSEIRAVFAPAAMDPTGQPLAPKLPPPKTQILDLGGKKVVIDPTKLTPGQTFNETPAATNGAAPKDEPLVPIMGPDNKPVLVPRSQAVGKRPASTREQGRPVMSSDANRIADLDTSLNDLNTLEQQIGQTGAGSYIGAHVPNVVTQVTGWGTDAKQRQAVIDRVKQVIGKNLEGGVLRKEDEYKYEKILPTIGDPPAVAKTKIAGLRKAVTQRRGVLIEALTDAGYDTERFVSSLGGPPVGEQRLINGQLATWDGKGWKAK